MFRQPFDPVHVQLNGMTAEGGKILFRDVIFMIDYVELGVVCIQPLRQMPPGNEVDLIDPGRKFFHSPEPEVQNIPVPETGSPYYKPPTVLPRQR